MPDQRLTLLAVHAHPDDECISTGGLLARYAAEGVQMSIKQMSAQLLSVSVGDQENYIDLQRMRARQIWDECKHSKLHADVLIGKGWVANEKELMDIAQANIQLKVGVAIGGTPNQPFATTSPQSLQTQFIGGPLVEAGGLVCQAGNVLVAISIPAATSTVGCGWPLPTPWPLGEPRAICPPKTTSPPPSSR